MQVRLRDKSGIRLYRFLVEDVDRHGNVRVYFRRKGQPKVRLRELPGTEAFDKEYQSAFRGGVKPVPGRSNTSATSGTMRWLCEQYYASAAFQSLAQSTRKVRRGILEEICQRAGNFRYAMLETAHVAKLRDEKAAFPHAANNRVKALRQLFAWANSPEYGYAKKNPARDVGNLRGTNPDGIRAWTEADAVRYEARHPVGTKARLAFDLLLYTGVRRSDVVKPLRQSIDATTTGHLVYLVTAFGKPHSAKAFGNWFKKRCREAGLEEVSAHGLRKLGAQRCAEAGATEHQLMALFGWANPQQAAVYTKKANRAKLEAQAAVLLQAQTSNKSVPLFTGGGVRWDRWDENALNIKATFGWWRPLP